MLETGIYLPKLSDGGLSRGGAWARLVLYLASMTIKIKVGSLVLTAPRDESLPQEFAAWHQTVRIAPGTYDVFAYLDHGNGADRVLQLSATCEGITVSSNFRSHMFGSWGKSDNNRNGQRATAHVGLPTYGLVEAVFPSLLAQTTLCDALVRTEWDPREIDPKSTSGKMWRFTWNPERRPIIIEQPRHGGGGTCLAALEDYRRFSVDGVERPLSAMRELDISFQSLGHNIDHLTINETATGYSWSLGQNLRVTRLA